MQREQNKFQIVLLVSMILVSLGCSQAIGQEVNVPGKPDTWFGTASRADIGHVIDYVEISIDPHNTFAAHDGDNRAGASYVTFKTPKAGRYVFAFAANLAKSGSRTARYKTGDKWTELPPGKIQPSYFRGWDLREFCYWIDIPAGQSETRFELPPRTTGALIAEPRIDPFEGMAGRGKETMFELPDVAEFNKSELGRAVLYSVWKGADAAAKMSPKELETAQRSLGQYEQIGHYLTSQKHAWSIASDGLKYRMSGDAKFAKLGGMKAGRMGTWPTWGYAGEWDVDKSLVRNMKKIARDKKDKSTHRVFTRNHTLSTTILVEIMAIGYDLNYGGMSEPDRLAYRKGLDRFAHLMYVRSILSPARLYGTDNWGGHMKASLGLAGAAMAGENRYASEWLKRFGDGLDVYASGLVDPKGVHRETIQYLGFGFNPCTLAAVAAARRGGPALFEMHGGRISDLLRTIVYLTAPNGQDTRDFGDTAYRKAIQALRKDGGMPGNVATMLIAMTHSKRPDLARWAARRGLRKMISRGKTIKIANSAQGASALNVLLFQAGAEKSPSEYGFPLGWHERCPIEYKNDTGYAVMQTGFDSADDVKVVLKCGHSAGGHGHPCQGSFTLDAYGDILSPIPGYNLWGRLHTESYNLITIDGEGQAENHASGSGRHENDGHIERFVHSAGADLCIANNKMAYDGGKNPLARSLRYFLFVRQPKRRGYLVIIDDVIKDDQPHEYTWNFHTSTNHKIVKTDGGFVARAMSMEEALELWKTRTKKNVLRRSISTRGGKVTATSWPAPSPKRPWVKDVRVDLQLATIWPREYTSEVSYKGSTYRDRYDWISDHLKITQKTDKALFFTILYPERKDYGIAMPPVTRIAEDGLWGAKLGDDTILFSRREGTWTYGDIETDARLVYLNRNKAGQVASFTVGEGTILRVGGKEVFASEQKVSASGTGGQVTIDDGGEYRATSAERGMP